MPDRRGSLLSHRGEADQGVVLETKAQIRYQRICGICTCDVLCKAFLSYFNIDN